MNETTKYFLYGSSFIFNAYVIQCAVPFILKFING